MSRVESFLIFLETEAFKKRLNHSEMVDFIIDHGLRDWAGKIEYEDAKHLAAASEGDWILTTIPIDWVTWEVTPRKKRKKISIPPIVVDMGDGTYEVIDGTHRLGELKFLGAKEAMVYLGKSED